MRAARRLRKCILLPTSSVCARFLLPPMAGIFSGLFGSGGSGQSHQGTAPESRAETPQPQRAPPQPHNWQSGSRPPPAAFQLDQLSYDEHQRRLFFEREQEEARRVQMQRAQESFIIERTKAWSLIDPAISRWNLYQEVRLPADTRQDQLYSTTKDAIAYFRDKARGNDRELAEKLTAGWVVFLSDPRRRYVASMSPSHRRQRSVYLCGCSSGRYASAV